MKTFLIILGVFFVLLVPTFTPVDTSKDNSVTVTGIVSEVSEGGYKDAVFDLVGYRERFYINRALVCRFDMDELKTLKGHKVTLMYAKHWSLLSPFYPGRHITQLRIGARVLYSEFGK
jgi:hypothetical protein